MVLEHEVLPYLQWLLQGGNGEMLGALPRFLLVMLGMMLFALVVGYAIAAGRHGILKGGDTTYSTVFRGFGDILSTSPRRVWAIARLSIKEAWRRRVFVALLVFFIILMFAGWFLDANTPKPARLYLGFVLTATTYLVLGIALVLSTFSLPSDFKTKTIYTVVTKPVHASEIVVGRILGFTIVATILLVIMGACSWIFVGRSLEHTHRVEIESLKNEMDAGKLIGKDGQTTIDAGHRHRVELDPDGNGIALIYNGHTHDITKVGEGDYQVSGPKGYIRARVPHYGKLSFIDRTGAQKNNGISVGNEWTYRSYIDGNTPATAIWQFAGVDDSYDPHTADENRDSSLPLALTVDVFRTHKGVIGKPISGTIQLCNPETELKSSPLPFEAREAQALEAEVMEFDLKREQTSTTNQPIDLYKELVTADGRLEVRVKCLEHGQYFGFAQADCYLRRPDGSPLASYAKVYTSIWVQAVIVIAVGVTISTLVSGPVAMLFTAGFIILGFYREDFLKIAVGKSYGGGPMESVVRIANQSNVMTKLDESLLATLVVGFDTYISRPIMWAVGQCLPDFSAFSTVDYAADGYNVPWDRVTQDVTACLGFVVALSILGFFLLRTREVAK
jgi:ABC-type transport system involved in multi-copper enzyme maturation permease subunit